MGEGAKGLEGEIQGTMEHFASSGLEFLRNLLIHWHESAFISGPAASPQAGLTEERRGPNGADSADDLSLPLLAWLFFHTSSNVFKIKRDRSPHYINTGNH